MGQSAGGPGSTRPTRCDSSASDAVSISSDSEQFQQSISQIQSYSTKPPPYITDPAAIKAYQRGEPVDLLSQPESETSPDAPYVVRALVLNECGKLLMCNTDSGLCPVGGRFYGSNAFGEIPYAANAVRFLRDEAGLHYDEARLRPLPKHSLWIAMADTKRGHEVAWVLAPVEASEVVQQSDRPLCWITSADLDPNAAGVWACKLKYPSHLELLRSILEPQPVSAPVTPSQPTGGQSTPPVEMVRCADCNTFILKEACKHDATTYKHRCSSCHAKSKQPSHTVYVVMVGVSDTFDEVAVHIGVPLSSSSDQDLALPFAVSVGAGEDKEQQIRQFWVSELGREPLGPIVYYSFHSDTCGECCGAAVYDRIRDGDRSTLDYYMHYRSVPLMMTESAYGGFDWHGDFLQEDSETRMMWQLASAFDDAGLSLTDPGTAVKLLDWNRICRHWQRLRHSMMNQYEIGLGLGGVLPHVWHRDSIGYTSMPTEFVNLVAEHFCLAKFFRTLCIDQDDSFDPVSIDNGSVELCSATDFTNLSEHSEAAVLPASVQGTLEGFGVALADSIRRAKTMDAEDGEVTTGGSPVLQAFKAATKQFVARLTNHPSVSPAIKQGWRSTRNRPAIEEWGERPLVLDMSCLRKHMAANLGDETLHEVFNELGMSMDESVIDDSDQHSASGVRFGDFIASFDRLVARHGWTIRFFNVDDPSCSHWTMVDRGVNLDVAKCKFCLWRKHPAAPTEVPLLCQGCMFPYHERCAGAHAGGADMLSPGICGNCANHVRPENQFNNAMWSHYNQMDRSRALKLERTANLSGSAAWRQPANVFLGIVAASADGLPKSQQGIVLRSYESADDYDDDNAEAALDLSVFAAHETISTRLLQTDDTPTGNVSAARARRFFRTILHKRLHVNADDPDVNLCHLHMHAGDRPGVVTDSEGAVVAIICSVDIRPVRLDSQYGARGSVPDWPAAHLTLPLPRARVVSPRENTGVLQSCRDVDRMLLELGGDTTERYALFEAVTRFFDHHAAAEAQEASTYLSDLVISDSDEEAAGTETQPYDGITLLSSTDAKALRQSIRAGERNGRSDWSQSEYKMYRKFVYSYNDVWHVGFVLAIDTDTAAVPLSTDSSSCPLATGHSHAVYMIEIAPSAKAVCHVAPALLTEFVESEHRDLAGTSSAGDGVGLAQPEPEPPNDIYVLLFEQHYRVLLPKQLSADKLQHPEYYLHRVAVTADDTSDPRLHAAAVVQRLFPDNLTPLVDLERLRPSVRHLPAGSVLFSIVLTERELALCTLPVVNWERTVDADGSICPVVRDASPHLCMFGLHDIVESDDFPLLAAPWMRIVLRHALGACADMDSFEPTACPQPHDSSEDDGDDGTGPRSPPTSPPDQAPARVGASQPHTPANAGGAKGSAVLGTSQDDNQNQKVSFTGMSPIASSASPLPGAPPDASMVEFIASQTSVLQSLVDQLNHRPQKDDDQHVTLTDGSRVKKVSIERSQSVLPGTIRQATTEEYKLLAKDADGNVAGQIFARKAIITIFMHGLHDDDKYLKQAETAAEAASMLAAIPKRPAHMPIADYARRIWLPRILELCLHKCQAKATARLLEAAGADLTKAWKQELSNRSRTADDTCKSDVVAFVCENDEALRKIYGDDVPMFGHKSYLHAECLYFLCCRDNSLTESKRKDLEWNAKSRLSIQSTMYMIILENGLKVEPFSDWLQRLKTEKARQKLIDTMARDDNRTWVIKMLYACPSPVQDLFWDKHDQTIFDEESTWDEAWMRTEIRALLTQAKLLRNFQASPAHSWGKAKPKPTQTAAATKGKGKGGGQGTGGGKKHAKGGRELKAAETTNQAALFASDDQADDCTEQELGVLSGGAPKGKGGKGKGKGGSKGKPTKGTEPPLVKTDGRRDTPASIENATGKPWSTSDCIPAKTQKAKDGLLYCNHPKCLAESQEFLKRNPHKSESAASTFNHHRVACPFEIDDRIKLRDQPDVDDARHAANIIRNKFRVELMENAFGKGSEYNRPNGKPRTKEAHLKLRAAQRDAGLFNNTTRNGSQ